MSLRLASHGGELWTHPSVDLETLLKHIKSFENILKQCANYKDIEWKKEDFQRAIKWAEYIQDVKNNLSPL
jgi:hypothetical protein